VVLVHDESGLYEQDLDGRLGFVNPVGLDVRTRTGEFLGKVSCLLQAATVVFVVGQQQRLQ
jgi:hypothetical protein